MTGSVKVFEKKKLNIFLINPPLHPSKEGNSGIQFFLFKYLI